MLDFGKCSFTNSDNLKLIILHFFTFRIISNCWSDLLPYRANPKEKLGCSMNITNSVQSK